MARTASVREVNPRRIVDAGLNMSTLRQAENTANPFSLNESVRVDRTTAVQRWFEHLFYASYVPAYGHDRSVTYSVGVRIAPDTSSFGPLAIRAQIADASLFTVGYAEALVKLETGELHDMTSRRVETSRPAERGAPRFTWSTEIETVTTRQEIIAVLRLFGRHAISDRLLTLQELIDDDDQQEPMNIDSLRSMARFLLKESVLPHPQVAVSPGGLLQAEWRIADRGTVAMEFLADRFVSFAAMSVPAEGEESWLRVSGAVPADDVVDAVSPIATRLDLV